MNISQEALCEQYRRLPDDELLDLARQGRTEYTEVAWSLLHEEVRRRGVSLSVAGVVREQPVRGLWFLAYIAPWMGLGSAAVAVASKPTPSALEGTLTLIFTLLLIAPFSIAMWYGISRRRVWGWWLTIGVFSSGPVLGALGGSIWDAMGGMVALILWGVYLAKRRHLFTPKHPRVAANESRLEQGTKTPDEPA